MSDPDGGYRVGNASVAELFCLTETFKTNRQKGSWQLNKMPARNVVSSGISNSNVKYSRLATDDDGYTDLQVRPQLTVSPFG